MAPRKPITLENIDPAAVAQAEAAARTEGISLAEWVARTIAKRAAQPSATAATDEDAAPAPPRSAGVPAANAEELAALKLALSRIAAGGPAVAAAEPAAAAEAGAVEAEEPPPRSAPAHDLEIGSDDRIGGDEPVIHRRHRDDPELQVEPEPAASRAHEPPPGEEPDAPSADADAPLGHAASAEERTSALARRLRLSAAAPAEPSRDSSASPEWLLVAGIAVGALVVLGLVAWLALGWHQASEVKPAASETAPTAASPAPAAANAPAQPPAAAPVPAEPVPAAPAPQNQPQSPPASAAAPAVAAPAPAAPAALAAAAPSPAPPLPPAKPAAPRLAEAKPAAPVKAAEPPHGPYSVEQIEKLAKIGDPRAAYDLATLYARGDEIPRDFTQAARWFKLAATQGIAGAQYNLGVLYQQGLGVAQDLHEAIGWYLRSAEQGYPPAEYNIGTAYADGKGVAADDAVARQWFAKAAEQGLAIAALNLGVLYEDGRGGPKDAAEAVAWYKIASRGGAAAAEKYLDALSAKLDPATLAEGNRRYAAEAPSIPMKPSLEPERRPPQSAAGAKTEPAPARPEPQPAAKRQASAETGAAPELAQIQRLLNSFGYDPGPADGQSRPKTTNAIRIFQREAGLAVDGRATSELLEYMKKLSGQP